jgi:hypothetical protein
MRLRTSSADGLGFWKIKLDRQVIVQAPPNSAGPPPPPPYTCRVTVYQTGNFGGWSASYGVGWHDFGAFLGAGASNDDAESIRVEGHGCSAWLYQHGDGSGWAALFGTGSYTASQMQ